jgi:CheY-like chemotaxis protein
MDKSLRFLVVDDMPQMCKIVFSVLTDLGWKNISIATSGTQALKLLETKAFDIMLLDNNMPGMEGVEVLEHMKAITTMTLPKVIMVTADCTASTVQTAIKSGASDFIAKPFKPNVLLDKVNKLMGSS